ncbi:hypothetical protein NPIL_475961 [Nephila pilipes]|uniref:Uncharacterized protein n=1 Tax=Nephila pilipes TaxID=299642 RepID=A0A8X6TDY1_NEPPI|nr:hypothetical protein NPIL_475961 [Nephila pilipes]
MPHAVVEHEVQEIEIVVSNSHFSMSRERQQRRDPEQADNWRDADKSNKRKTPSLLFYFRAHLVMEFSRCHGDGSHALMRNRLWSSVQGLEKKG